MDTLSAMTEMARICKDLSTLVVSNCWDHIVLVGGSGFDEERKEGKDAVKIGIREFLC